MVAALLAASPAVKVMRMSEFICLPGAGYLMAVCATHHLARETGEGVPHLPSARKMVRVRGDQMPGGNYRPALQTPVHAVRGRLNASFFNTAAAPLYAGVPPPPPSPLARAWACSWL